MYCCGDALAGPVSRADDVDPGNRDQAGAWDGGQGAWWAANAERFDATVAGYRAAFRAAAAPADADVLDVGCGTGQTTRDAVRDGARSALGVDLSSEMLAVARRLAEREGLPAARFVRADAQVHPFAKASVDLVLSRTGTMFFADPSRAFANLARALRPKGRLVLLVWGPVADNEWLPALSGAMTGRSATPAPDAPGPFSLSEPERVRGLLAGAGLDAVALERVSAPMVFGSDPADAEPFVLGLFAGLLASLDDDARAAARRRLWADLDRHADGHGVRYGSSAWLVTASRP